ncbi:MAG TPA: hypothetical protein VGF13_19675 [Verrucomicrobiae bacterium]|jgi:hypothetical protein
MQKKPIRKIRQILTAPSPIFAVFCSGQERFPKSKAELVLESCPIVALVEEGDWTEAVGLILGDTGYEDPAHTQNFLGYARSEEEALARFGADREMGTLVLQQ